MCTADGQRRESACILGDWRVPETLFYIVYAIRERLTRDQLKQCVARDAYTSLLGGDKKNYSKKLKELYPTAPVVIKDRAFLDYLALPVQRARPLG